MVNYAGYGQIDKEVLKKMDDAVKESLALISSKTWTFSICFMHLSLPYFAMYFLGLVVKIISIEKKSLWLHGSWVLHILVD